jgi:hypothetical protein
MNTADHNKWVRITYFTIRKAARENTSISFDLGKKLGIMANRCMQTNAPHSHLTHMIAFIKELADAYKYDATCYQLKEYWQGEYRDEILKQA